MGKIVILDEITANKIAAGEVIERPASVIKELVENSIDAGATHISIETKNGGISFIKVSDNGSGIAEDDVEIAFERHGTSKIRSADDLEEVRTMGFRGEALASIASVARVQLVTRVREKAYGMLVEIEGGNVQDVRQTGCPVGTTFTIHDLFFNTPARYKFLKSDSTESGYISDIISRIALGHPNITFKLISNRQNVLHTPGNDDLLSVIFSIYGKEISDQVSKISYDDGKIKISGYTGKPEIARSNRNSQSFYVNGRYVKSKIIGAAIDQAYHTFLMKKKYPLIVLKIDLHPMLIDVNVHPAKTEIRFSNEQEVFRGIYIAVNSALLGRTEFKAVHVTEKKEEPFKRFLDEREPLAYTQQPLELEETQVEAKEKSSSIAPVLEIKSIPAIPKQVVDTSPTTEEPSFYNDTKSHHSLLTDGVSIDEKKSDQNTLYCVLEQPSTYHNNRSKIEESISAVDNVLKHARLIGQVFSTYVLLQHENDMILIDQHAAHERILYEKLKKGYHLKAPAAQWLVVPMSIQLTHQEFVFLNEEENFFKRIGFVYENFGNNSIILRSIPLDDPEGFEKQTFMDIVDRLMDASKTNYERYADEAIHTIACKAAVKANHKLEDIEIKELLVQLSKIDNPFTCPHGRPTAVKMGKNEFEKMFKRIV